MLMRLVAWKTLLGCFRQWQRFKMANGRGHTNRSLQFSTGVTEKEIGDKGITVSNRG